MIRNTIVRVILTLSLMVLNAFLFWQIGHAISDVMNVQSSYGHVYDVYFDTELKDAQSVRPVVKLLHNAMQEDVVRFHIANYGGDEEGMEYVLNAIKTTKALTISYVEAPSYSADAYIAASTKLLVMEPNTFLMFHTTSIYGTNCDAVLGTDRGHSASVKCHQMVDSDVQASNQIIDQIKILTPEEKQQIELGYDVYLTAEEIKKRQIDMRNATVKPITPDPSIDNLTLTIIAMTKHDNTLKTDLINHLKPSFIYSPNQLRNREKLRGLLLSKSI